MISSQQKQSDELLCKHEGILHQRYMKHNNRIHLDQMQTQRMHQKDDYANRCSKDMKLSPQKYMNISHDKSNQVNQVNHSDSNYRESINDKTNQQAFFNLTNLNSKDLLCQVKKLRLFM
jgi:hypothetical protein